MGNMSQASPEGLRAIAKSLRDNCNIILGAKREMDSRLNQVYGTYWKDPVADAYVEQYRANFEPIERRLIPLMRDYSTVVDQQATKLEQYLSNKSIPL